MELETVAAAAADVAGPLLPVAVGAVVVAVANLFVVAAAAAIFVVRGMEVTAD